MHVTIPCLWSLLFCLMHCGGTARLKICTNVNLSIPKDYSNAKAFEVYLKSTYVSNIFENFLLCWIQGRSRLVMTSNSWVKSLLWPKERERKEKFRGYSTKRWKKTFSIKLDLRGSIPSTKGKRERERTYVLQCSNSSFVWLQNHTTMLHSSKAKARQHIAIRDTCEWKQTWYYNNSSFRKPLINNPA